MPAEYFCRFAVKDMNDENKEEKIILARALDALEACRREDRICWTDFLDMRMQGILEKELRHYGARYFFEGGYDTSE